MWIPVYDTLPDHGKIVDLSTEMKMDRDTVVGKIIRLWHWAIANRENGYIRDKDVPVLSDVMRLKCKPEKMVNAMVEVGLLDKTEGGYVIHDYNEYSGAVSAKKERDKEAAKERMRAMRNRNKQQSDSVTKRNDVTDVTVGVTRNKSVTVTDVTDANIDIDNNIEGRKEATVSYSMSISNNTMNNSTAHAREGTEFSTTCGKPVDNSVENSDDDVAKAFRDFYRRDALAWEIPILRRLLKDFTPELVWKALGEASLHGAEKPLLYARKALLDWQSHGIEDLFDLQQWREDNGYD